MSSAWISWKCREICPQMSYCRPVIQVMPTMKLMLQWQTWALALKLVLHPCVWHRNASLRAPWITDQTTTVGQPQPPSTWRKRELSCTHTKKNTKTLPHLFVQQLSLALLLARNWRRNHLIALVVVLCRPRVQWTNRAIQVEASVVFHTLLLVSCHLLIIVFVHVRRSQVLLLLRLPNIDYRMWVTNLNLVTRSMSSTKGKMQI